MKKSAGWFEAVFDGLYLCTALVIGVVLLCGGGSAARTVAGVMALVLAAGDAFHLIPRMRASVTGRWEELRPALSRGKLVTSLTMTVFYVLLWEVGVTVFASETAYLWTPFIVLLGAVRAILCLLPQNQWESPHPPVRWGVYRNIPFLLMGAAAAVLFALNAGAASPLRWMWLAVALSFGFYLPVVLGADRHPWLGALMLPKTCAYVWILVMCLSL